MTPVNRIATDEEILKAVSDSESYSEAAVLLGMAKQTLKNRMHLMKKKAPESSRPTTYTHKKTTRYFISSVISDAPLHNQFFKSIQVMCDYLDAHQIYIPVEYSWQDSAHRSDEPSYPKQVREHLLSDDIDINKNLKIMGSYPIHATIQNPLTGLAHVSDGKSAIFGHPQRSMVTVATLKSKLPKLQYTTGSISLARYTRSKAGRKAEDLHHIGGLIVEVKDDKFFIFEVTSDDKGCFYHLTERFTPNGIESIDSIPAIYMADEHAEFYPEDVKNATYTDPDSIVNTLCPDLVIRGDVYNHGSDSHHGRNNVLERVIRDSIGKNSVQDELDQCYKHIADTTVGGYKNVVLASNHHDHLKRWLNEFNPHTGNPKNVWLYHQLNADMISQALNGYSNVDPFVEYGKKYHPDIASNCIFVGRDEEFFVSGVDCSQHGDLGPNGARGSARNLSACSGPSIIGHGHSPCIVRNIHQVGASGSDYWYNKGPSGWMCTHALIYPDGSKTMLNIIQGEWRA